MATQITEGQLCPAERAILASAVLDGPEKPRVILEVGTWLGGGSTVTFLRALHQNGVGHLWGIEADPAIYERMMANLKSYVPEAMDSFTPMFGFSQRVIPDWLAKQPKPFQIDIAFLDGGNSPEEQMTEFYLIDPYLPVGARLFGHDARMRKGKYLVPFLSRLDNWEMEVHDVSEEGLLSARKIAPKPSAASLSAARAAVWKLRLTPAEIAAALLPSPVIRILLRFIPRKLARRLTDGRK